MNYLKNALSSILGDKNKIESDWYGVGQQASSLGLSLEGVASDFKELTHQSFPESKNAYLKLCRKAFEFADELKSYFKDNKQFSKEIRTIADESGHTVKKLDGVGLRINNSNGPFIDVDFAGNIEFRTKNISAPSLERYIDAVTSKFKGNEAFIVFKGGQNYSDADNQELLRIITKSMIANDINFNRLHLADSKYQSIVDEMTPIPTRVELVDGKFIKSDKPYLFNQQDAESVLAHRGLNLIKYSGGNILSFDKYKKIYEQEHNIQVQFHENSEIITFKAIDSNSQISFRTASIREGGARLKEENQINVKNPKSKNEHYLDTGLENKYNEKGQKEIKKSAGLSYA